MIANPAGSTSPCLAVIVPVFNEAATVDELLRRVLGQACVAEVLVVDDGSTDGTAPRLEPWHSRDNRVRILRHESNQGKGAAIRTALAQVRSEFVVIQDADLEYDPADYQRLLDPVLSGRADVVYGSRFLTGERVTTSWHRFVNRSLTGAANLVTGLRLTDVHTCLKLFRRGVIQSVVLEEERFGFCAEITAKLAGMPGVRVMEVPVRYRPRRRLEGKKVGWRDGLRALFCLVRYRHRGLSACVMISSNSPSEPGTR